MYLNKALIYGNLTRDPDVRALPSGQSVVSFSIATNRVFTDRDGKKQEQTDFHNIVAFGRTAESVGQYLKKGSGSVRGRPHTDPLMGEGRRDEVPDGNRRGARSVRAARCERQRRRSTPGRGAERRYQPG